MPGCLCQVPVPVPGTVRYGIYQVYNYILPPPVSTSVGTEGKLTLENGKAQKKGARRHLFLRRQHSTASGAVFVEK